MPDRLPVALRPLSLRLRSLVVAATVALATALPAAVHAGTPSCTAAPLDGCRASRVPAQTRIWLRDNAVSHRDTLVWKWQRGSASTIADFGDPVHAHGYATCIYDAAGSLIFHASVPSGGPCRARPCWRAVGAGFHYRSGAALPDGLTKMLLIAGPDGKASVIVKGRGPNLHLPALPLVAPVTVQVQEESGPCWAATYEPEGVRLNDGERFRAGASQ
jgi:hypothetical protein